MNNEWLMILCMGFGGTCFAIGGTGPKWVRRIVLPILFGVISLVGGVVWYRCLIYSITQYGMLTLGYGESLPIWRKVITAIAYILPTLILGFSFWQIIFPISFILMFKLSNTKITANLFVWKIVEFLTGSLLGVTVAHILKDYTPIF